RTWGWRAYGGPRSGVPATADLGRPTPLRRPPKEPPVSVSARHSDRPDGSAVAPRSPLFSILVGVSALLVLLQGLWAGLFIHEKQDYAKGWVQVHSIGGNVALLLALAALVVVIVKLRSRRDLLVGSIAYAVLLAVEGFLGSLIGDHAGVAAVHIPLAMALMGLAVYLPLRARR
ncbi:MAG: hypothetical protein JWP61_948, partial [Friedmanniella sp.]|nr:hypothetical protein [Friedmanniella sp.]